MEFSVFKVDSGTLKVLTLPAGPSPFQGDLTLPSQRLDSEGYNSTANTFFTQALRMNCPTHIEQVTSYRKSQTSRSVHQLSLLFLGLVRPDIDCSSRQKGLYVDISDLSSEKHSISPHDQHMVQLAKVFLSNLLQNTTVATLLCPELFTLGRLRQIYECVWNAPLDNANFRRRILRSEGFVELDSKVQSPHKQGRPSHLYRAGSLNQLNPSLQRPRTRSLV